MINTLEPLIRQHQFFQGMEERHIPLIAGCAKNVRFEEGCVIFHQGDPADQFYLIHEGRVAVELIIPARGLTTVQTVGEGDVLGWSWLLPAYRWSFHARAQQPTRALAFNSKCLRAKCEKDHDLGYEVLKRLTNIVTERLEATNLQLLDVYGANS
jgi:CRP/FNR family cyclic AMP-dependent transcriptional regulator